MPDDWRIYIDYGDGLVGEHMDVRSPLVRVGDKIKAGDPVALGIPVSWISGYHTGEFNLIDKHRRDGVEYRGGTTVSPFDYLRDDVKQQLVDEFTEKVIEPYIAKGIEPPVVGGESLGAVTLWEPYLTNPLLIHRENKGAIVGEWMLKTKKWAIDDSPDMIIFLIANTRYYNKNRVTGFDEELEKFVGTWEADYSNKTFVIYSNVHGILYGIFELDESGPRAILKLEYQPGSYPTGFSDKALTYIERDAVQRRQDAVNLGVMDSK